MIKTRAVKSLGIGLMVQPILIVVMLPVSELEGSFVGDRLLDLVALPLLPGYLVDLLMSGNPHGGEVIHILVGLGVNMLLHSGVIYTILYFKETFLNRSTSGE